MWTELLLGLSGVLIGAGVLLLDRGTKRDLLPNQMWPGRATGSRPSEAHTRVGDPAVSFAGETESAEAWARSARALCLAMRATNAAFAAAGAQLVQHHGPSWSEPDGGHRTTYLIEHDGRDIAILTVLLDRAAFAVQIQRHDDSPLPAAIRIVAADTATVPRLAEAIAACAWPCVAQASR